jgi:hypothetical protein
VVGVHSNAAARRAGARPRGSRDRRARVPGKVCAHAPSREERTWRLAIADTGHDRVLLCAHDGEVLAEHGGLYQPQGVRWADDGDSLLVCETGAGRVWRIATDGASTLVTDALASPWDVVGWHGHVVVAEAGRHRLWAIDADGEPQVIAGSGGKGLFDGPALGAGLAQPSGLAVTAGDELAWVDAGTSALRALDRPAGHVRTFVGEGLFDWGTADGGPGRASMQHPLGVAEGRAGELWVADTFNDRLRVWREGHLWTVPIEGFDEPGGLDALPDGGSSSPTPATTASSSTPSKRPRSPSTSGARARSTSLRRSSPRRSWSPARRSACGRRPTRPSCCAAAGHGPRTRCR